MEIGREKIMSTITHQSIQRTGWVSKVHAPFAGHCLVEIDVRHGASVKAHVPAEKQDLLASLREAQAAGSCHEFFIVVNDVQLGAGEIVYATHM
ncbi:hypothetical protein A9D14_15555 (plasmid) [Croceicoccus marinus]|uniref:Uncharacterized protein n=2 Tax=Croceicoccus marinus TaxID=450378 RepID=A0A1Z1FGE9_9SPHN|nr:hypothetical protein A9D14_15555 [Croceicoccus marinus]